MQAWKINLIGSGTHFHKNVILMVVDGGKMRKKGE